MLSGWSQSLPNWTVWKQSNDTIITYNFTKSQLTKLRLYIISLEETRELYNIDQQLLDTKDSMLLNYRSQLNNNSFIIANKDSIITFQRVELLKADKWGKSQEQLKIKYKKQVSNIPYWFGGGTLLGIIMSILLIK